MKTLDSLIDQLTELKARYHGGIPVEMMIEFEGRGQWQAQITDVAVSLRRDVPTLIILIHEDT